MYDSGTRLLLAYPVAARARFHDFLKVDWVEYWKENGIVMYLFDKKIVLGRNLLLEFLDSNETISDYQAVFEDGIVSNLILENTTIHKLLEKE
jgi:hypothetical protein